MREPVEFQVGGHTYQCGYLKAPDGLSVVRKLSPLVAAFRAIPADVFRAATDENAPGAQERRADLMMMAIGPLTEEFAKITEADQKFVLGKLLGIVQRKMTGGGSWGPPLWNKQADELQDEDLPLPDMMLILGQAIMVNLGNFTSALRSIMSGPAIPTSLK